MRKLTFLFLVLLVAAVFVYPVLADGPICTFNPDGSITCVVGGGGGGDGGEEGGGIENPPLPPPVACAEGEVRIARVIFYQPEPGGTCTMLEVIMDTCLGEIMAPGNADFGVACPEMGAPPPPQHPCDTFIVTPGGITCDAIDGWEIEATVHFPETYLDVRPFPATLVRWPSAIRNGGMPSSSGSGSYSYYGTGSPGSPRVGDLSNIRLTLTLNPASPMFVTLPHIGSLSLPDQGSTGNPQLIQWEVPSHPAAGGGPLARNISGMDELPGDIPLFVGSGRSAYSLSWRLTYDVYEGVEECLPGPNGNGVYNCGNGTGHRAITSYEWRMRSSGGDIPPGAVAGLPAALAADLNGDGSPDAYWNNNLTLRRMDDANRVDNPTYQRSWNWGGIIYWGVREGQGQIGWPGQ